jgi:hypothetical protein
MQQLGYGRYGIVMTDLGWFTRMWMVSDAEDSIIGHISDFFIEPPVDTDRTRIAEGSGRPDESAYMMSFDNWFTSY